jgi:hypothetical protein
VQTPLKKAGDAPPKKPQAAAQKIALLQKPWTASQKILHLPAQKGRRGV